MKNDELIVSFPYNPEIIQNIRELPGAKWDRDSKTWKLFISYDAIQFLKNYTSIPPKVEKIATQIKGYTGIARLNKRKLIVRTTYDEQIIHMLKLLGGMWDPTNRVWIVSPAPTVIDSIKKKGIYVHPHIEKYVQKLTKFSNTKDSNLKPIKGFNGELMPFQKAAVKWILKFKHVLIADSMGLGKTIEVLAAIQKLKHIRPVLIISPLANKLQWEREANKWLENCPENKVQVAKTTTTDIQSPIVIVNYDVFSVNAPVCDILNNIEFKFIVLDESHYIKNNKANRTKAIKKLIRNSNPEYLILLSGTPAKSKPVELFTQLNLIEPELFGGFMPYARRYCGAYKDNFGWHFDGASNLEELSEKLRAGIMIRRTKDEVLEELPDKKFVVIPLPINNTKDYVAARDKFVKYVDTTTRGKKEYYSNVLSQIEGLRQIAVKGKLQLAIEWIKNFLDSTDEKLVVFTHHRDITLDIKNTFTPDYDVVSIMGNDSAKDKDNAVNRFQNDPNCRLFVGTIGAAGVGITLTAASNVVFVEYPWTPSEFAQALDRCHRIGQKSAVTGWCMVASLPNSTGKSIDEIMLEVLLHKQEINSQMLDNGKNKHKQILEEIIRRLRTKLPFAA